MARLGDVSRIVAGGRSGFSGQDFVDDGYPAYGAGGLNGHLSTFEHEDGAVILSSIGARCGKCFFPQGKWTGLANTQLIFPDPEKVDRKYLWYQLNDEGRWRRSGTAQPYIKPSDVKSSFVSLPPLPEQRRIASILDHADALRDSIGKRRSALSDLALALFEQAAADITGECIRLSDLFWVSGGKRLPKGTPYADESTPYPYLRVSDMADGSFRTDNLKYVDESTRATIARYIVDETDLVISIAGTIGAVASVPEQLAGSNLTENAARLRPKTGRKFSGSFMKYQLASPKVQRQIKTATGQVTIGKLPLYKIEGLEVSVPDIRVQERFERDLAHIDSLRIQSASAEQAAGELFASLQHRAFTGQL